MDRLTYEIHDGRWCVDGSEVRTFEIEDNVPVHSGNAICKLRDYEDLEEKGFMIKFPFKIGQTVFEPNERKFISSYEIISIHISKYSTLIGWRLIEGIYSNLNGFEISALGKKVFLTRNEAEIALSQL